MKTKDQIEGDVEDLGRLESYPPSWADRLVTWIHHLPGESWLYYTGTSAIFFLGLTLVSWYEGYPPRSPFFAIQLFFSVFPPICFGAIPYLDTIATRSLRDFRPALKTNESEYQQLEYRLTTLLARPTFVAGLLMLAFMILVDVTFGLLSAIESVRVAPISFVLLYALYKVGTFVFGTFIYHTIHQLRWVNRIYTRYAQIDLFDLSPLYALSKLTALTAGGIILIMYLYYAINPGSFTDPISLSIGMIFVILAIFTFIWPLRGAHALIKKEKNRWLREGAVQFKLLSTQLHRQIEANDLQNVGQINAAVTGLETEREVVERISTWPWQPETLRTLITSILVPIAIWLLQYIINIFLD